MTDPKYLPVLSVPEHPHNEHAACGRCGNVVADPVLHEQWHAQFDLPRRVATARRTR